jgi:L-amino acid N-acyltransferase YncA
VKKTTSTSTLAFDLFMKIEFAFMMCEGCMISIIIAEERHIEQIAEITDDEARRSVATVASSSEPIERWRTSWASSHISSPWLVAIDQSQPQNQEVIGYAKAGHYNPREGFRWSATLSVYIKPQYKGQKLGHRLYDYLFPLLRAMGYQNVYARIALPNPASQALHQRFGLSQTGVLPRFAWKFNRWHDMAIYTGDLCEEREGSDRSPRTTPPPERLGDVYEEWTRLFGEG